MFLSVTPAVCWCSGSPCPLSHTILGSWSKTISVNTSAVQDTISPQHLECSASGVVLLWGVTANTGKKRKIKPIGPQQPTNQSQHKTNHATAHMCAGEKVFFKSIFSSCSLYLDICALVSLLLSSSYFQMSAMFYLIWGLFELCKVIANTKHFLLSGALLALLFFIFFLNNPSICMIQDMDVSYNKSYRQKALQHLCKQAPFENSTLVIHPWVLRLIRH